MVSSICTSPKLYCTSEDLLVRKSFISLISGMSGKFSCIMVVSVCVSSKLPSASTISDFNSSDISSHKSSSEACPSLFRSVRASSIVVLPLSLRPTNVAKSPTDISPESCIHLKALTRNLRNRINVLYIYRAI